MRALAGAVAAGMLVLGGCSTGGTAAPDSSDPSDPSDSAASANTAFLFVQQADSATFEPDGEAYRLVLSEVDGQTLLFADRPARDARVWPTQRFVDRWDEAFGDDPPNAVVVGDSAGGGVPVELSDPQYSASQDTLTYSAELLGVEGVSADLLRMSGGTSAATQIPSGALTDVSVFIDDSSAAASADRTVTIGSGEFSESAIADSLAPALQSMAAAQVSVVGIEVDYQYDLAAGERAQEPVLLTHKQLASGGQQGSDPQSLADDIAVDVRNWLDARQLQDGELVVHLTER